MLAGLFMAGLGYSIDIARILAAILAGVGIGLSAWVVARRTGEGDGTAAAISAVQAIWIALLVSLPFAAAGICVRSSAPRVAPSSVNHWSVTASDVLNDTDETPSTVD